MSYIPLEVTQRTLKLREAYLQSPVGRTPEIYSGGPYRMFCTGDRWMTLGFLEGWMKCKYARTTKLRVSLAEAAELYASEPVFYEDELLAGHLYLPEHTKEEQERYNALCDQFEASSFPLRYSKARLDHIGLDFDKLLTVGIEGILEEIKEYSRKNSEELKNAYPNLEAFEKDEFYECARVELEAVLDLAARYSKKAAQLAEETVDQKRKKELLRISESLQRVPAKPAETFFDALQSIQFLLSTLFGLYPINRPDRYLFAYYKKDMENGLLTKEEAQELIDNFCLLISTRVHSRAACGFIVGGQDAEGNLVENDLTYMFLTALEHIRMSDPNGALAVNQKTSDEILRYSVEILAKGVTHPAFFNDDAVVRSLEGYGVSREDAVNYIHATCAEISVVGKSKAHSTPITISLPELLLEIVKEQPTLASMEELLQAYRQHLAKTMGRQLNGYMQYILEASRIGAGSMRVSCFVDDCIRRGKSVFEGGERYCFVQPIFVGFATLVDSLFAIKQMVYENKTLTLEAFYKIVESDFEGQEPLRQFIIHKLPHYGNDIAEIDGFAAQVAKIIEDSLKDDCVPAQKLLVPGTFSYINHALLGEACGATFDGRRAFVSLSDGCSATQGRDVNGPTAMVNSLTSWNQEKFLGGMVVNVKFSKSNFSAEKRELLVQIIRTFMKQGGIEMQINSVDRATLEDALVHPENHGDLLVRIGGYSDYFVRLTPSLQQEVMERTEY